MLYVVQYSWMFKKGFFTSHLLFRNQKKMSKNAKIPKGRNCFEKITFENNITAEISILLTALTPSLKRLMPNKHNLCSFPYSNVRGSVIMMNIFMLIKMFKGSCSKFSFRMGMHKDSPGAIWRFSATKIGDFWRFLAPNKYYEPIWLF